MSAPGNERSVEKTKISRRFWSSWLADTGNPIFSANSLVLAIMPVVKEHTMEDSNSLIQLPIRHCPWNKGKLIGPKPPLRAKHVWLIRTKLQLEGRKRDLALFNLAIDSKLRGCDVVAIRVEDVAPNGYAVDRATVRQKKTGHPARFEITEQTRQALDDHMRLEGRQRGEYLFRGRNGASRNLTTRRYARLVSDWVASCGLDPSLFGTHSLRWTKATIIYKRTGNLRAVQLLLGHTEIESTVRYLGIEIDDALEIAEQVDI
jgi:integrase